MSDHLPECPEINEKPDWYCCEDCDPGPWDDCICDWLRACEQRVLDAAREAVLALKDDSSDRSMSGKNQPDEDYYWAIDDAAAAIDALRGEQ